MSPNFYRKFYPVFSIQENFCMKLQLWPKITKFYIYIMSVEEDTMKKGYLAMFDDNDRFEFNNVQATKEICIDEMY